MSSVGQVVSLDCDGARRVVDGLLRVEGGLAVGPYDPVRLSVPDASLGAASGALMSSLRVFEVLASTRSADLGRELASRVGLVLLEDDLRLHLQLDAPSEVDGGTYKGSSAGQGAARGSVGDGQVAPPTGDATGDDHSLDDLVGKLVDNPEDVRRLVEWILRIILETVLPRLPLVPASPRPAAAPSMPPFAGCRPSPETMQRRRAFWSVPS